MLLIVLIVHLRVRVRDNSDNSTPPLVAVVLSKLLLIPTTLKNVPLDVYLTLTPKRQS